MAHLGLLRRGVLDISAQIWNIAKLSLVASRKAGWMRVIIIGAGQLGSRHAESLAKLPQLEELLLVDPSKQSLETAQDRVQAQGFSGEVRLLSDLTSFEGDFELAVISTSSSERLSALRNTLQRASVRHVLLEKLLCPSTIQLDEFDDIFSQGVSSFWLNCPTPFFPHNLNIAGALNSGIGSTPIQYTVTGGDFGLVTNSIHYLEHFQKLTKSQITSLRLRDDFRLTASKRTGYTEIIGCFLGETVKGDTFSFEFDSAVYGNSWTTSICQGENFFKVDEAELVLHSRIRGIDTSTAITIPRQSALTHMSLKLLLDGKNPMWAEARETVELHRLIFRALDSAIPHNRELAYT